MVALTLRVSQAAHTSPVPCPAGGSGPRSQVSLGQVSLGAMSVPKPKKGKNAPGPITLESLAVDVQCLEGPVKDLHATVFGKDGGDGQDGLAARFQDSLRTPCPMFQTLREDITDLQAAVKRIDDELKKDAFAAASHKRPAFCDAEENGGDNEEQVAGTCRGAGAGLGPTDPAKVGDDRLISHLRALVGSGLEFRQRQACLSVRLSLQNNPVS